MNIKKLLVGAAAGALMLAFAMPTMAVNSTIKISNLQPSWTVQGGGGVFSAYVGPPDYGYVSPGTTKIIDGEEAGIIKAGINIDSDGHYWDEGLFAFQPNVTINDFATLPLNYVVENQYGNNPVWMTIEIDTGVAGNRSDNVTYQYVPTPYGSGWNTVDPATGLWQKWNSGNGDVGTNPLITLNQIALDNDGKMIVRAYLRLGMGDSYSSGGTGTIAWVDKTIIAGKMYDFVVNGNSTPGLDRYMNNPGRQQATEVGAQCGSGAGSGTFGYLGRGFNMAGGADGRQTGLNNSGVCGNRP